MTALHQIHSHSFASDNYSGVLPEILTAINNANGGHVFFYD